MTGPYATAMAQLTAARTAQMLDACSVTRATDPGPTPDLDADGNPTAADPQTVYEGRCTVSDPTDAQRSARTSNDDAGVPNERVLKVPHTAALRPGDVVTVTASAFSPGLVGDRFVVAGEHEKSYATSRRYAIRGSSWLPQA